VLANAVGAVPQRPGRSGGSRRARHGCRHTQLLPGMCQRWRLLPGRGHAVLLRRCAAGEISQQQSQCVARSARDRKTCPVQAQAFWLCRLLSVVQCPVQNLYAAIPTCRTDPTIVCDATASCAPAAAAFAPAAHPAASPASPSVQPPSVAIATRPVQPPALPPPPPRSPRSPAMGPPPPAVSAVPNPPSPSVAPAPPPVLAPVPAPAHAPAPSSTEPSGTDLPPPLAGAGVAPEAAVLPPPLPPPPPVGTVSRTSSAATVAVPTVARAMPSSPAQAPAAAAPAMAPSSGRTMFCSCPLVWMLLVSALSALIV